MAKAFCKRVFSTRILDKFFLSVSSGTFGKGQHEELWKKVCTWKLSGGAQSSKPFVEPSSNSKTQTNPSLHSNIKRAKYFVSRGFAAKAFKPLNEVGGIAPKSIDTFEKLKSKHPSAEHLDENATKVGSDSPLVSEITVDIEELEKTLKISIHLQALDLPETPFYS